MTRRREARYRAPTNETGGSSAVVLIGLAATGPKDRRNIR
jgi:hypothetical protein